MNKVLTNSRSCNCL